MRKNKLMPWQNALDIFACTLDMPMRLLYYCLLFVCLFFIVIKLIFIDFTPSLWADLLPLVLLAIGLLFLVLLSHNNKKKKKKGAGT